MITSFFKPKAKPDQAKPTADASTVKRQRDDENDRVANKRTMSSSSSNLSSDAVASLLSHLTEESWKTPLDKHFRSPLFARIAEFVAKEHKSATIFPPLPLTFSALNLCPLDQIKVVIVGQDPYHGPNQAHGLAFSVLPGEKVPPSLRNIYKELLENKQIKHIPNHGHLIRWAKQGVLLLNTSLTVRQGQANSHAKIGWHATTDEIIKCVLTHNNTTQRRRIVFLLWGKPATEKTQAILQQASKSNTTATTNNNHVVICTSHPSPLGATKTNAPFMGSKCFSRCNAALVEQGLTPIDWNVDGPLP